MLTRPGRALELEFGGSPGDIETLPRAPGAYRLVEEKVIEQEMTLNKSDQKQVKRHTMLIVIRS